MRRLIAVAALIVPSLTAVAAVSSPAGATTTTTTTITTTGETPYVVPANVVSLQVTVIGAAGTPGGSGAASVLGAWPRGASFQAPNALSCPGVSCAAPGTGAKLVATLVQPTVGTTLFAEVGNVGGGGPSTFGGYGGGASSLQTCTNADVSCTYTASPATDPRLLVAGGGGGGGELSTSGGVGGNAGAALAGAGAGGDGSNTSAGAAGAGGDSGLGGIAGVAGTQSSDCVSSPTSGDGAAGTAGFGGAGGNAFSGDSWNGGGGGDGWFGGGGGGAGSCASSDPAGGGGGGGAGSSYAVASATGVTLSTATDPATVVIVATIGTAPVITSTNHASFTVGTNGSFTVTSTCDPAAMLTESGSLPSGVTFMDNGNGTATLAGTPAAGTAGTYPFIITASGCAAPNATQSFSLVVSGRLAATGSSLLTEGMVGLGLLALAGLLILADRRRRHLGA